MLDLAPSDKLTASYASEWAYFGSTVAIGGETVAVYAQWDADSSWSGSVYIFRTGDGGATYVEVAKLTAADAEPGMFGWSMSIDGDTIAIGATGFSFTEGSDRGAVYIFRTSDDGATYGQIAKLIATDAADDDQFGYSVAMDGGTVVIGAPYHDDAGSDSGSVYIFRTSDGGATYSQVAKLTAADAATGARFGISVAIDGDTVVAGADGDETARARSTSSARPTAAPRMARWPS